MSLRPETSALVGEIRAFLEKVWDQEPEDIRRLRATRLPPGGRWSGVLFCNLILLWSGQTLMTFRTLARAGKVPAEQLAVVTAAHLRQLAAWIGPDHWHLDDTAAFLNRVADRLDGGAAMPPEDFARVVEELLLVINRVQNWCDAFVPWAQLDALLPPISRDQAPGRATPRSS